MSTKSSATNFADNDGTNTNNNSQLPGPFDFIHSGFSLDLFLAVLAQFLVALCGTFLNLFLIAVTIRNKSLRSSYNFLLAFMAICDVGTALANIAPLAITGTGRNAIPLGTCFWLQLAPSIFVQSSMALVFLIALDRLLSVLFPVWHRNLHVRRYTFLLSSIPILCYSSASYFGWQLAMENWERPVPCGLIDVVGLYGQIGYGSCAVINALTILCYLAIWRLLSSTHTSAIVSGRILNSLLAICLSVALGWFTNAIANVVLLPQLGLSGAQLWFAAQLFALLPNATSGANAPILYLCSSEYRQAMRTELGRFSRLLATSTNSTMPHGGGVSTPAADRSNGSNHHQQQQERIFTVRAAQL